VKRPSPTGWLRIACVLAIVALLLMSWSLFDPRPAPVLIALSLGQAIGTASFVVYLSIVAWDVRRKRKTHDALDALVLSERRPAVGEHESESESE